METNPYTIGSADSEIQHAAGPAIAGDVAISHVGVLQFATIGGLIVTFLGFIVVLVVSPFVLLDALLYGGGGLLEMISVALFAPLIYGAIAWIACALIAWSFNMIAPRFGGLTFRINNQ